MLSKVSIKDHPHHKQIIDLAKEIHAGELKHLRQGKNTRNYLLQAKTMFEASQLSRSSMTTPSRPQPEAAPLGNAKAKVTFTQMVKEGKQHGAAVFQPKLGPMNIPVAPKPKEDWQTVQCKKATRQGTKMTMVSGMVPVMHQIPREMLLTVNDEVLTRQFVGILELVPGAEELINNNPLKHAHWLLNRDILQITFKTTICRQ